MAFEIEIEGTSSQLAHPWYKRIPNQPVTIGSDIFSKTYVDLDLAYSKSYFQCLSQNKNEHTKATT